ncbi:Ppx/GppA phosphatase family protein [Rhodothermus profundi]|uniref:Exopolyphosphatase / guanosine-5'-triphosphate,3'-diphosphate pyrophosphatase n=1 Tax=Rhodothermus profundi TaxID=633813 RepID=A0A1M6PZW6_9BACT|nr:Ppx/GppA phosphatase family protein [Rhodothermus profundi]SHK13488.1 exopolyphosphatase / guanosine-5'-triphosphate,3'-diphosphate pyrophosphatase [Rhodothermus profundi]
MSDADEVGACPVPLVVEELEQATRSPVRMCVIDLGTNSFHAVIVDALPGTFRVVDRFKEMVRLGEEGLQGQCLSEEAMQRAVRALRRIRLLAEGWGATEFLACATSAIREAENGGELLQRIRNEVGLHVRVIDGLQEARLIYKGVRRAVSMPTPTLIMDVGGGSVEFIVGTSQQPLHLFSLKLGAARMTRRFIHHDPATREELRALRAFYRKQLQPVFEAARAYGVREVVGSSGAMENLASVCARKRGQAMRSIYEQAFPAEDFRRVARQIVRLARAQRRRLRGIDPKRVDQIVAAAALIDVVLKELAVERVRVSPHALREGLVVDFVERNAPLLARLTAFSDVRRRSIYEMGWRFDWEYRHAQQVAALALQLFDATQTLHGLGATDRELLEYAALLHDIGYHISHHSHHKHGLYLIKHADLRGFTSEEIAVLANVVRYHRGSLPKPTHADFVALSEEDQARVCKLAALLRLAEGLDRSHNQNVRALHVRVEPDRLVLHLETRGDPELEVWGVRRSADLFTQIFGRAVVVTATAKPSLLEETAGP